MIITQVEHFFHRCFCVHKLVVEFGPELEHMVPRGKLWMRTSFTFIFCLTGSRCHFGALLMSGSKR